jgi:hypothetical protein
MLNEPVYAETRSAFRVFIVDTIPRNDLLHPRDCERSAAGALTGGIAFTFRR